MTYEHELLQLTNDVLEKYIDTDFLPEQVAEDIIDMCNGVINIHNSNVNNPTPGTSNPSDIKWDVLKTLKPFQVARAILVLHKVVNINTGSKEDEADENANFLLGIYNETGTEEERGLYITKTEVFRLLARAYKPSINNKEFDEVISYLHDYAPIVRRCEDPDMVPVKNGIVNYRTKEKLDFTPDMVFLSKSKVDYNPNAKNVVIHNDEDGTDWDIESWSLDLFNYSEPMQTLIFQIIGAFLRPGHNWGKAAFFYNTMGNGGKGTICSLIRNILGINNCANIQIADMSKRFDMSQIIGKQAIITDENDVGEFVDRAGIFKAIVTHDPIGIERKYKDKISYEFKGFMVQCFNDLPKSKDKTDSLYRRQLFVPFPKSFTGVERKYIKDDYLKRQEVLEYVQYKVLNMDYDELIEPEECRQLLDEYKTANDPIRDCLEEILPEIANDVVPTQFIYDVYKAWYRKNVDGGKPKSSREFMKPLRDFIEKDGAKYGFEIEDRKQTCDFDKQEDLIPFYKLEDWRSDFYTDFKNPKSGNVNALKKSQRYGIVLRRGKKADA